jgi:hypothetical protein
LYLSVLPLKAFELFLVVFISNSLRRLRTSLHLSSHVGNFLYCRVSSPWHCWYFGLNNSLLLGAYHVHFRMFNSILALCLLDTNSTFPVLITKNVSCQMSPVQQNHNWVRMLL